MALCLTLSQLINRYMCLSFCFCLLPFAFIIWITATFGLATSHLHSWLYFLLLFAWTIVALLRKMYVGLFDFLDSILAAHHVHEEDTSVRITIEILFPCLRE